MDSVSSGKLTSNYQQEISPTDGIYLDLSEYNEKTGKSKVIVHFEIEGDTHQMILWVSSPDMRDFINKKDQPNPAIVKRVQHMVLVAQSVRNYAIDCMAGLEKDAKIQTLDRVFRDGQHYRTGSTFFPFARGMFAQIKKSDGDYETLRRKNTNTSGDYIGRELRGDSALYRSLTRYRGLLFSFFGSIKFTDLSQGIVYGGENIKKAKKAAEIALENSDSPYITLSSASSKEKTKILKQYNDLLDKIFAETKQWEETLDKQIENHDNIKSALEEAKKACKLAQAKTNTLTKEILESPVTEIEKIKGACDEAANTLTHLGTILKLMSSSDNAVKARSIVSQEGHKIKEVFYRFGIEPDAVENRLEQALVNKKPAVSETTKEPPNSSSSSSNPSEGPITSPEEITLEDPSDTHSDAGSSVASLHIPIKADRSTSPDPDSKRSHGGDRPTEPEPSRSGRGELSFGRRNHSTGAPASSQHSTNPDAFDSPSNSGDEEKSEISDTDVLYEID